MTTQIIFINEFIIRFELEEVVETDCEVLAYLKSKTAIHNIFHVIENSHFAITKDGTIIFGTDDTWRISNNIYLIKIPFIYIYKSPIITEITVQNLLLLL